MPIVDPPHEDKFYPKIQKRNITAERVNHVFAAS